MTLNILGTEYTVSILKYEEDPLFENCGGYCDSHSKRIAICDMHTAKGWQNESEKTVSFAQKKNTRHEIVHAFLHESGLMQNANQSPESWAINEEMVDWIAIQGPKIYKAWQEADAL